jgi:FKBP-type peptidyl-prolyl cis-trans isomerase
MKNHFLPRLACVLTLALAAGGCPSERRAEPEVPIESATFAPALGVNLAGSTKTASGLYYRDLETGNGPELRAGQRVAVHYRGTLPDGTEFDANQPGATPFAFRLGAGDVIAGWDEGVVGMRVGGRRQLIIPPALGYGERGTGPIPGNAILVFTVTAVSAE